MNLSAREFVYEGLNSLVAKTKADKIIKLIAAWVEGQYVQPHDRQVQGLRETNTALRRQMGELSAALRTLLGWANIQDCHSEQARQVRDKARDALARQEVTE